MTNVPFGFSLPGDDDSPEGGRAPNPGAFDLSQLGSMLSQLGQMMSQAGASGSTGPVNYDLARRMAASQVPASHPVASVDLAAVRDAMALAEVWLDGSTSLPVGATSVTAWTPREWIDATMPAWEQLCSPIAERVSQAWIEGLPEQARAQAGPLLAMMGSMGGMAFGSQLGQGLAQLAGEVLTSTDIGLPLGPSGTAALLPRSIAEFSAGLELPEDQVRLYLAAREAAHHRLFAHVPWLRNRIIELISEYAGAISVDFSAMEELASSINPSDPSSIEAALSKGMFEPTSSPGQQQALQSLETLLALVEGWVDAVVADAVGDRLPGAAALRETLRRRRATGGPAEQTFATLIGLQLRPRRLRAAAELWRDLQASRGIDGRDALWSHPDLLPGSADLDDPRGFVARDREFSELLAGIGEWDAADLLNEAPPDESAPGGDAPSRQASPGGDAGSAGQQDPTGDAGSAGEQDPTGDAGSAGRAGDTGDDGSAGPDRDAG